MLTLTELTKIWRSKFLLRKTKISIFLACVESVLLYNATTWTLNESLKTKLDGTYTRLLRYALNYKWSDRIDNDTLYGTGTYKNKLRPVSERLKDRRLTFLGHCWRSQDPTTGAPQPISDVMFWTPQSKLKVGRPSDNYLTILKRDIDISDINDIQSLMEKRDDWICQTKPYLKKKEVKANGEKKKEILTKENQKKKNRLS